METLQETILPRQHAFALSWQLSAANVPHKLERVSPAMWAVRQLEKA